MTKKTTGVFQAQDGTVLPLFALAIFAIIGAVGLAIDYGRAQMVQSKLHAAIDAAGLAAGSVAGTKDVDVEVRKFAEANFPQGYMGATYTIDKIDQNGSTITIDATGKVETTFMRIFGNDSVDVAADTQVTRGTPKKLEFVMALDVTGSMASNNKIGDLRVAANEMIDVLYNDNPYPESTLVSVVPYSITVNVGPDKTGWLRNYDLSKYPANYPLSATKWKGCVESRTQAPVVNNLAFTDDVPEATRPETLFPMWFWPSHTENSNNPWYVSGNVYLNQDANYPDKSAKGPNVGCGTPVVPFTYNTAKLHQQISALVPWRRGGTSSEQGMGWAYRMISPKWGGLWKHDNGYMPAAYKSKTADKAVMIMTDGVNDLYMGLPYLGSDYSPYGFAEEQKMGPGINNYSKVLAKVNSNFTTICNNMKNDGITIYAVTFQLGSSASENNARALFRNCASKPEYYFDSPDGATLKAAFGQIAESLVTLRISR